MNKIILALSVLTLIGCASTKEKEPEKPNCIEEMREDCITELPVIIVKPDYSPYY